MSSKTWQFKYSWWEGSWGVVGNKHSPLCVLSCSCKRNRWRRNSSGLGKGTSIKLLVQNKVLELSVRTLASVCFGLENFPQLSSTDFFPQYKCSGMGSKGFSWQGGDTGRRAGVRRGMGVGAGGGWPLNSTAQSLDQFSLTLNSGKQLRWPCYLLSKGLPVSDLVNLYLLS